MRILLYIFISCVLIVLAFLAFPYVTTMKLPVASGTGLWGPAACGFLGGILGGLLGSRLLVPAAPQDDSGKWKLELRKLREEFESDRRVRMVEQRNLAASQSFVSNAASRWPLGTEDVAPREAPQRPAFDHGGDSDLRSDARAKAPGRAAIAHGEIMARYRETVSGTISRSSFGRFLDGIGRAGPVSADEGGRRVLASNDDEGFLVSAANGTEILVFPSYNFVANQETQFNTIASVPEAIASVFNLVRGDGDIALSMPAVYRGDDDGAVLISKGEIRGFSG